MNSLRNNAGLSLEQVRQVAPAVFATGPSSKVSDRYAFVPTASIVEDLVGKDFVPVFAQQSRHRTEGGGSYSTHMLRFRHKDQLPGGQAQVGDSVPEIVLTNSHNLESTYGIHAGVYRLVCTNGMVVADSTFGSFSVRHLGGEDVRKRILDATYTIAASAQDIVKRLQEFQGIELPISAQVQLASRALELKTTQAPITVQQLLESRRPEDHADEEGKRSLWVATNVIQENLLKGGLPYTSPRGRRLSTRAVRSVVNDLSVNRGIWALAAEYAQSV